jgi:hypothetical protein
MTTALFAVLPFTMLSAHSQTSGGDPFEPHFVDSMKCNANGTSGCTQHRTVTVSAGPDRVFLPDTLEFRESSRSGGGSIWVDIRHSEMVDVPVTVAGAVYEIEMPRTVDVVLHAESGSGASNFNRGAWINGYLEARTIEVER